MPVMSSYARHYAYHERMNQRAKRSGDKLRKHNSFRDNYLNFCPKCGGKADFHKANGKYFVRCMVKNCRYESGGFEMLSEAVEDWNKRPREWR